MSRFVSDRYSLSPAPDAETRTDLKTVSSRAFNRDRLLAADPSIIPTTEDKARAMHNPYRVRGPYAMVSPHFR